MSIEAAPVSVLDACAMLAFLRREPGALRVDNLLAEPDGICYAHAVNLCEVYYDFLRTDDLPTARQAIAILLAAGVSPREDMTADFWQQVGDLKVNPGRLSLADCFALALALLLGGTLVTSDHHEFDRIDTLGLLPILFIR